MRFGLLYQYVLDLPIDVPSFHVTVTPRLQRLARRHVHSHHAVVANGQQFTLSSVAVSKDMRRRSEKGFFNEFGSICMKINATHRKRTMK